MLIFILKSKMGKKIKITESQLKQLRKSINEQVSAPMVVNQNPDTPADGNREKWESIKNEYLSGDNGDLIDWLSTNYVAPNKMESSEQSPKLPGEDLGGVLSDDYDESNERNMGISESMLKIKTDFKRFL